MDKKFVGNLLFQGGCLVGVLCSGYILESLGLSFAFLGLQIGMTLMHWED